MSFNLTGLMFCGVKPHNGSDKAAAIELDVDVEAEAVGVVGEALVAIAVTFCDPRLCNCRAFASAFSWVRTKCASCFGGARN